VSCYFINHPKRESRDWRAVLKLVESNPKGILFITVDGTTQAHVSDRMKEIATQYFRSTGHKYFSVHDGKHWQETHKRVLSIAEYKIENAVGQFITPTLVIANNNSYVNLVNNIDLLKK
jgi:hypothetical protein